MAAHRGWGLPKRLMYYAVIGLVFACVGMAYFLWLDNYYMLHPEVVEAVATGYVEELPLEGVLVWDEQLVTAPRDGILTYPSPQPRRVAKGEAVAAVDGVAVNASTSGYFLPALDGQEGNWVYSRLWPGISRFPSAGTALPLENGAHIQKGMPVGKLVPQPQDLRCIAYLDRTPAVERDVKLGFVEIRTESFGKSRRAAVRAFVNAGQKIKVYLTFPFFPPSVLSSRFFACSVMAGDRQGVLLPDTAVLLKDGQLGVLLVKGSVTKFTLVEGFPADEKNFFITKGLQPGSIVVLHADKIKEGVIRLW